MNKLFSVIEICMLVSCKVCVQLSPYDNTSTAVMETYHSSTASISLPPSPTNEPPSPTNKSPSPTNESLSPTNESLSPTTESTLPLSQSQSLTSALPSQDTVPVASISPISESPSNISQSESPTSALLSQESTSLPTTPSSTWCMIKYTPKFASTRRALFYSQFDEKNDNDVMFQENQHCLLNAGNTAQYFGISISPYETDQGTYTDLKVTFCCTPKEGDACNNKTAEQMIQMYKNEITCYKLAHPNWAAPSIQPPDCGDGGVKIPPRDCRHEFFIRTTAANVSEPISTSDRGNDTTKENDDRSAVKKIIHIILAVFGTLAALLLIGAASIVVYTCYRGCTAKDRRAQAQAIAAAKRSELKSTSNDVSQSDPATVSTDSDNQSPHAPSLSDEQYKANPVVYIDNTPPDLESPSPVTTKRQKPASVKERAKRTTFE